jgi:hypothetical protein
MIKLPDWVMKHWLVLMIGVGAAVLAGTYLYAGWKMSKEFDAVEEDDWRRARRWQGEFLAAITNRCEELPGFKRIATVFVMDSEKLPEKWTAEVGVDFVNTFGGISRTNLGFEPFYLHTDTRNLRHIGASQRLMK